MPRIVPFPHPAPRYESRPIERIDDEFRTTVRTMFDLMYENRGIGLAANQVALPFRFFILNITADREQPDKEQVFINPEIVKRHSSVEEEEGCLSLPGLYAKVRRAKKIRVKAFDLNAQEVDLEADDLLSRRHPARGRPPLRQAFHRLHRTRRSNLGIEQDQGVRGQVSRSA